MFLDPAVRREPAFGAGFRHMAPLAAGIGAWGLMTGVAMVKSGMSVVEATAMTLLVYAGSSQLAAIPLLVAGAPAWVILATGFCINLRFVVFSLHLRPYLMHMPRWRRMTHGYLTADLSYAVFTGRYPTPATTEVGRREQEAFLTGGYCVTWLSWMGLSLVGILCSMATTRLRLLAAAIAGVTAVAAYALPLKLNIVTGIGVAVLLSFWLERQFVRDPEEAGA